MGSKSEAEIDAWLREGGLVITSSERSARAVSSRYHRARQSEGLKAWSAPNIQDWNSFVRSAWMDRSLNGKLILNRTQEQSLWADLAQADGRGATLLEEPRYRLAELAQGKLLSKVPKAQRKALTAELESATTSPKSAQGC